MGDGKRVIGWRGAGSAAVGGVVTAAVVAAAIGGYALYGGSGTGAATPAGRAGPGGEALTREQVERAAARFLDAWERGDVDEAAAATDDRGPAGELITSYARDARVGDLALTPGPAAGARVPFSVRATVTHGDATARLTYAGALTVVPDRDGGAPRVDWRPSVVHPDLRPGDRLTTGRKPVRALDREGGELTAAEHPSLVALLDELDEEYGASGAGPVGAELRLVRGAESRRRGLSDRALLEVAPGSRRTVRTTLDPKLQAEARLQVDGWARASVVVTRVSTGEILAVADSDPASWTALRGALAPGSTMKVVTASLLIEKGLASADAPHPCPKYFTHGGWKFHNDKKFEIERGNFRDSFGSSCNTAFVGRAPDLAADDLTRQAREVFGLGGGDWAIGVPAFGGSVPVQRGASMAAALIGQGGVRMSPLTMASVAATVRGGTFRPPYLVRPAAGESADHRAERVLSRATLVQLRDLMAYTAGEGTAKEAMAGVDGERGAKTGSAEVVGQEEADGWFTAYRNDLAAAGVVRASGHGGETAGPMVAALLRAGR
ncbi:penicillin-binding transpeptidase domain-containing protein [Streptomyces sp. ZYX-F-203]